MHRKAGLCLPWSAERTARPRWPAPPREQASWGSGVVLEKVRAENVPELKGSECEQDLNECEELKTEA